MRTDMVVNEWVQTDGNQWLRQAVKEQLFEMLQINITPTGDSFVTFNYVNMCDIDLEDLNACLNEYGYHFSYVPGYMGVEFMDFNTQIAAECYLETYHDYEAKFQGTRKQCEEYVKKVIAYLNKHPMFLEELESELYRGLNIDNME